jgi:hypothetical protein
VSYFRQTTVNKFLNSTLVVHHTDYPSERDVNQDYEAGWKRYGFAAPFAPNSKAAKSSDVKRPALEVQ